MNFIFFCMGTNYWTGLVSIDKITCLFGRKCTMKVFLCSFFMSERFCVESIHSFEFNVFLWSFWDILWCKTSFYWWQRIEWDFFEKITPTFLNIKWLVWIKKKWWKYYVIISICETLDKSISDKRLDQDKIKESVYQERVYYLIQVTNKSC